MANVITFYFLLLYEYKNTPNSDRVLSGDKIVPLLNKNSYDREINIQTEIIRIAGQSS